MNHALRGRFRLKMTAISCSGTCMKGSRRAIPILLWGGIFTISSCSSPEGGTAAHPRRVNLTTKAWFPPVVPQQASSCAQHAGLYYLLACEINRARGGAAGDPSRRLSPYLAYGLLADDRSGRSHVVDGWLLSQETGVPSEADLPSFSPRLMHGFDRYRRALANRPASWNVLPLETETDLRKVQRELDSGHPVACEFPIRGTKIVPFPEGMPSGCGAMVRQWGQAGPGHAMVYAGYDLSIGRDANGDGRISSNLDITGDGRITLADWEQGAFLLVNPWGKGWGDRGMAWVLFREHALSQWPWARSVATVTAAPAEPPRHMLRLSLQCPDQSALTLMAQSPGQAQPWQPLLFREASALGKPGNNVWEAFALLHRTGFRPPAQPLQAPGGGPVELGFAIPASHFSQTWSLQLSPRPGHRLSGTLAAAELVELSPGGQITRRFPLQGLPAAIPPAGATWTASSTR